jgi:hypothetical protein
MSESYKSISKPSATKMAKFIKITNLVVGYIHMLLRFVIIGFGVLAIFSMVSQLVGL